ncbi:DUF1540 domain-containing protein [Zhaonella formicivorans]|uniref:DUF1540 domain-containing protein n=1 Tax=Zhaonella formicivorans TaxID=2528593 RepID=UPI001D1083D8|nr:DUF1540 domain-containing protein [Zhaonella formicivorans]
MPHNSNIKCTVSNCRYWHDEHCDASAIEVNVDGGGISAQGKKYTQCHTFEQK